MNALKRLPNLIRWEIDYKLSTVYAWHPDTPTISIAVHEKKVSPTQARLTVFAERPV